MASSTDQDETTNIGGILFGVVVVPALFSFYTFYVFLFKQYSKERKLLQGVIYALVLSFASFLVGSVILYLTMGFGLSCHAQSNFIGTPIIMSIGLIFGSIGFIFKGFLTWYREIKLKEELLEKNHRTEMALVKSQLDPHFLFNTINNIDVLILRDPEEASNYLNKLSDIMRFMLFDTKTDKIPLTSELAYIEKYIELQKIRTSNANYVSYQVNGIPAGKSIAPMIFIPFIENAFKHSNNKKIENAISIEINITNDEISLLCVNKFSPFQEKGRDSLGLGNDLIQKRLELIYPENHTLIINKDHVEYRVHLTVSNEEI